MSSPDPVAASTDTGGNRQPPSNNIDSSSNSQSANGDTNAQPPPPTTTTPSAENNSTNCQLTTTANDGTGNRPADGRAKAVSQPITKEAKKALHDYFKSLTWPLNKDLPRGEFAIDLRNIVVCIHNAFGRYFHLCRGWVGLEKVAVSVIMQNC
jgi:hypothetical protein